MGAQASLRSRSRTRLSSREQRPTAAIPSTAMVGNTGAKTAGIIHQNQVLVKTLPSKSLSSLSFSYSQHSTPRTADHSLKNMLLSDTPAVHPWGWRNH